MGGYSCSCPGGLYLADDRRRCLGEFARFVWQKTRSKIFKCFCSFHFFVFFSSHDLLKFLRPSECCFSQPSIIFLSNWLFIVLHIPGCWCSLFFLRRHSNQHLKCVSVTPLKSVSLLITACSDGGRT